MKVKLDENLPGELVQTLAALGHDVHTVRQEGLAGKDDSAVLAVAISEGELWSRRTSIFPTSASSSRAVMLVSCLSACAIPAAVGWESDSSGCPLRSPLIRGQVALSQ